MASLDAIGLVVKDMPASLAFYRRLGLDIPFAADREAHAEVTLSGGMRLMWDTEELVLSFSKREEPSGGHRIALAFRCADPGDVDAMHARIVEAGHPSSLAPFDAYWGQRYATVLDPDDNPVDLFAPLA